MGHMSSMESVSNVRVCVRIMHLVINQPEDVIMGVAITGLEYFVKVLISLYFQNNNVKLQTFK